MNVWIAVAVAAGLAACASTQPAYVPPKTPCEAALRILASPYATPGQTLLALEAAKNHGCAGQQPVQRIQVVR